MGIEDLREKLTGHRKQIKIGLFVLMVLMIVLFLAFGDGLHYIDMTIREYTEIGMITVDDVSSDNKIGRLIQKIHRRDRAVETDQSAFPQVSQYTQLDYMPEEIEVGGITYQQIGYGVLEKDAYTEPLSDQLAEEVEEFTVSLEEQGDVSMTACAIDGVDTDYAIAVKPDSSLSLHTFLYVNPSYCEEHTLAEILQAAGIQNAYVNMKNELGSFWLHYVNVPGDYLIEEVFADVGTGILTEGESAGENYIDIMSNGTESDDTESDDTGSKETEGNGTGSEETESNDTGSDSAGSNETEGNDRGSNGTGSEEAESNDAGNEETEGNDTGSNVTENDSADSGESEAQKTGLAVIIQTNTLENIVINFLDNGSLEFEFFLDGNSAEICYRTDDTSLSMGTGLLKYLRKNGTLMEWNRVNYRV